MTPSAGSLSYDGARFGIAPSILMPGHFVDGIAHFADAGFPAEATVQGEQAILCGEARARNEEAARSPFPQS
ncbi:hypothetical protein [Aquabacter spiritensis]|uniref:Uncharacterized protein n=1 Tax=Aquabacter spiritensis TaxID=933073 RepID=A0A4R3LPT6_9HYPH|nr:hypothetical protein [Aquabacter spiritensis]TCT01716.1 hypothetical protein EDC64_11769 [Aquabacter spiritensis]